MDPRAPSKRRRGIQRAPRESTRDRQRPRPAIPSSTDLGHPRPEPESHVTRNRAKHQGDAELLPQRGLVTSYRNPVVIPLDATGDIQYTKLSELKNALREALVIRNEAKGHSTA